MIFPDAPRLSGVYKFTNRLNNKIYIGKALDLYVRLNQEYERALIREQTQPIIKAIRKYGWDAFDIEILQEYEKAPKDKEARMALNLRLLALEVAFIDYYESNNRDKGYNICLFGTDLSGVKYTKAEKSIVYGSRMGENHHSFGKKMSEETKRKIALGHIGRKASLETRIKMSRQRSGVNGSNYGKHPSEETRAKMSQAKLGKPSGIKPMLGKIFSEEHRRKISEAGKLWDHSFCKKPVKQIDKISDKVIKIWASASDAARELGFKGPHGILGVCGKTFSKGYMLKTAGGFKWEFISKEEFAQLEDKKDKDLEVL